MFMMLKGAQGYSDGKRMTNQFLSFQPLLFSSTILSMSAESIAQRT